MSINGLLPANWKAPCSLGTLDHASAAGVVQGLGPSSGVKECSHLSHLSAAWTNTIEGPKLLI